MPAPSSPEPTLIADRYLVDLKQSLPGAGGGLPAFAAKDQAGMHAPLMAVQVQRRLPARAQALMALTSPVDGVLTPLARGPGPDAHNGGAFYVISQAPPGPSLSTLTRTWTEAELLENVLRPAARTLDRLVQKGLTHRAIRPDNVFHIPGGVVLGFAWGAPPALHQPAVFEAPGSAMCLPAGRGDGSIADDVYALGVLLLTLAMGQVPLAGLDDQEIIRRKLALGSFEALAGSHRLPPAVADLARGMLAEDPEHRPSPALLTEPWSARTRRVAARPPRRAPRPLNLGGQPAWDARTLAYAVAKAPEASLRSLRAGLADEWLRRGLGEPTLAARLDDSLRLRILDPEDARGEALSAMRAVSVLDPLAPLCWRGVAIWPDGLGSALAASEDTTVTERLIELAASEGIGAWASMRGDRCDAPLLRTEARQYRNWLTVGGATSGLERLMYMLNPLLPCASPLLGSAWVSRVSDLLPTLEARVAQDRPKQLPIDRHIGAFIAARSERGAEDETVGFDRSGPLAHLSVLARLQVRWNLAPAPSLAKWLAEFPGLVVWRSKTRRQRGTQRLNELAAAGQLMPMVMLLRDEMEQATDKREAAAAARELERIEKVLSEGEEGSTIRTELAYRWGRELATGIGLAVLATSLAMAAFG